MKGRDLPSHIVRDRRGVLYFRRGSKGKWIKLETQFPAGEPVPFALHQEREKLLKMPVNVAPGKDMAAVIRYYKSKDFAKLAPRTKQDYDVHLAYFNDRMGAVIPAHVERVHIIRWQQAWLEKITPHKANYRLRILSILFEVAKDMGLLKKSDENPVKGVKAVDYEKEERLPWPADRVKAFRDAYPYDTRERLCFEMCLGTGQRISDVLRMQWGHIQSGGINVRQGKTKKRLWVPLTAHLQAALDVAPKRSLFILAKDMTKTKTPGPWAYRSASQALRKAREAVDALDYDLHSLRYSAASELLAAGADDATIAAITGQSQRMVEHYTRSTRQKVLAMKAKEMRE